MLPAGSMSGDVTLWQPHSRQGKLDGDVPMGGYNTTRKETGGPGFGGENRTGKTGATYGA